MARTALCYHAAGLEHAVGDFGHPQVLVSLESQHEVTARVRHQVSLVLSDINGGVRSILE
jgi:hypothetical protein